jgi:hypothetical protein
VARAEPGSGLRKRISVSAGFPEKLFFCKFFTENPNQATVIHRWMKGI